MRMPREDLQAEAPCSAYRDAEVEEEPEREDQESWTRPAHQKEIVRERASTEARQSKMGAPQYRPKKSIILIKDAS